MMFSVFDFPQSHQPHYPFPPPAAPLCPDEPGRPLSYLTEYRKRRSEWHNRRKSRKKAAVYGSALFTAVVLLDNFLSIV